MLLTDYGDTVSCLANLCCFNSLWNLIIVLEATLQITPHARQYAVEEVSVTKEKPIIPRMYLLNAVEYLGDGILGTGNDPFHRCHLCCRSCLYGVYLR